MFRVVRAATLGVRGELYVTAARAAGLSHRAILWRHLAPRLGAVIRVQASMIAALAIAIEIGLGFLGLDVAPPSPSWGAILEDASHYLSTDFWMIIPPVVVIALTILSFGVLGEAVRPVGERAGGRRARRARRLLRGAKAPSPVVPLDARRSSPPGAAEGGQPGAVVNADPRGGGATEPGVLVSVRDLTVRTTDGSSLTLVDHVSFDVRRGEVLGFVGETGAGKSVIARSLVQLFRNTEAGGSVVFDGNELIGADRRLLAQVRGRRIAYVGQDPASALDPLFRVESQLVEAVRNHRSVSRRAAREEALGLLKLVRIREPDVVARRYPFELSGGQAQRVAIALALAGDPELLIADEPTTALDVTVQMRVLGLLKTLQRERGLTMILVTHDWGVVADVCDRVLTLYAGEIVETGDVRDVFSRPSHPYTAALRRADPHLQPTGSKLLFIPGSVPAPGARPHGCRFADRCPMVIDECRALHPALAPVNGGQRASRCIRAMELREGEAHV
jgi:peptide/nickel transport system permease protein